MRHNILFICLLLGLSNFVINMYARKQNDAKPLIINNVRFETQQNMLGEYRQTTYRVLLSEFDIELYRSLSDEAFRSHVASRKWVGTLNGVTYNRRGTFIAMLQQHPKIKDVYEHFTYRLDEDAYADLVYDGVELRYTLTEKQEPYLLKKYHDAKLWAKCFWMILRIK